MTSEETRKKIISSATAMFSEHGCRRITMDDIAGELHISKRTLYEYFEKKEDLLTACFETLSNCIDQRRRELMEQGTSPIVMMLYMFRRMASRNNHLALMISDTKRYYPEIYDRFFRFDSSASAKTFRDVLTKAQEEGMLRENVDIDAAHSVMMHFLGKMSSAQKEDVELISECGFTFVRGLLSHKAIMQLDQQEQNIRNIIQ